MLSLYDCQIFLPTALPITISVINFDKKYFIVACNPFRLSYCSPSCLKNSARLPELVKAYMLSYSVPLYPIATQLVKIRSEFEWPLPANDITLATLK